jgi:O-antigen ligase
VGAGAWEVHIPLYQPDGAQLETDYYAHNEYLQLVAEDGLLGVLVLLGLAAYLLRAAWTTWRLPRGEEAAWRAVALTSLLALLVVSNVGFAWRMASTGALFALTLACWPHPMREPLPAARPRRCNCSGSHRGRGRHWRTVAGCAALAAFITWQAVLCEAQAGASRADGDLDLGVAGPEQPALEPAKAELLRLTREGIAINPHYRKLTPIVADELALWGDWKDATWVWESVLRSRPYIVAILTNAARGHAAQKEMPQALQLLARAQAVSPDAPSVRSLEVILLAMTGQPDRALTLARQSMQPGQYDFDLLNNAYTLARQAGDLALAERALRLRIQDFPTQRSEGWSSSAGSTCSRWATRAGRCRPGARPWRRRIRAAGRTSSGRCRPPTATAWGPDQMSASSG